MKRGSLGGREGMGASLSLGGVTPVSLQPQDPQTSEGAAATQPGRSWVGAGPGEEPGGSCDLPLPHHP